MRVFGAVLQGVGILTCLGMSLFAAVQWKTDNGGALGGFIAVASFCAIFLTVSLAFYCDNKFR